MKIINVLLLTLFFSSIVNAAGAGGPGAKPRGVEIEKQKPEIIREIERLKEQGRPAEMSPGAARSVCKLAGMEGTEQQAAIKNLYKSDPERAVHVLSFLKAEKDQKFEGEHREAAAAIRGLIGSIRSLGGKEGMAEFSRLLEILPDLGAEGIKLAKELMGEFASGKPVGESTLSALKKVMPEKYVREAKGNRDAAFKKFLEDFMLCLEFFKA